MEPVACADSKFLEWLSNRAAERKAEAIAGARKRAAGKRAKVLEARAAELDNQAKILKPSS